jgi:hypothetical protein
MAGERLRVDRFQGIDEFMVGEDASLRYKWLDKRLLVFGCMAHK